MDEKPTKIIYGTNIERQENYIDIHDCSFSGNNFYLSDMAQKAKGKGNEQGNTSSTNSDLVGMLLPAFKHNEAAAIDFVSFLQGSSGSQITKRVTQLVEEGVVEKSEAKSHLWQILHDAGFYSFSRQNWDNQVKIIY